MSASLFGQNVNIPDANFKAYLVENSSPQTTYVPDDNFEVYLEANGMGNGIANDDSVTTANINTITTLYVNNRAISDLTGIEDFTSLTTLYCGSNQLTSLDVSQNTALTVFSCSINQLTSLDVSQNTALIDLYCYSNPLTSLDVTANTALIVLYCHSNQLTSLDVSVNTALTTLGCLGNLLTSLDVSANTALTYLDCDGNQLTSLDVRNGNNQNFLQFYVNNNPNLTCINVDDVTYSTNNWTTIDAQHYFSTNCTPLTNLPGILNITNTERKLVKITDMLGRETPIRRNTPLLYIYNDGTTEKRIILE